MQDDRQFVPRGAIAFFVSMVLFYAVVWGLMVAIMIGRR